MDEGFFYLKSISGKRLPILVHGYQCPILKEYVYGFNTHDGGGVIRLSDVTDDCILIPVQITEIKMPEIDFCCP